MCRPVSYRRGARPGPKPTKTETRREILESQMDMFSADPARDRMVRMHTTTGAPRTHGSCYVLWCKTREEVKIGRTRQSPSSRARSTSRPWEIWRVWCSVETSSHEALERCMHDEFHPHRITHPECGAREFFAVSKELAESVLMDYAARIEAAQTKLRLVK